MSAQEVAYRLIERVESQSFKVRYPDSVQYLLDGFETNLLIKADDLSNRHVTDICARTAVQAARRRMRKFARSHDSAVFLTDFIPAFEYIGDLSVPRNRLRFPPEDTKVFTTEISELIRQSCPWC